MQAQARVSVRYSAGKLRVTLPRPGRRIIQQQASVTTDENAEKPDRRQIEMSGGEIPDPV